MTRRPTGARRGLRPVVAGLGLLLVLPVLARDDPRGWLDRMGYALEALNYEGTLVQLNGSDVAVMRIVHRVDDGVATERITATDEVGREIIRDGEELTYILPDQHSVLVERRDAGGKPASPLRQQFAGDARFDDTYYRLTIASGGKVLGRDTRVVTVRPTDSYRYGYRLWLCLASAMPLKVQIFDEGGAIVEQLLFSDISLRDHIPAASVQPSRTTDAFTWRRSDSASLVALAGLADSTEWRAEALPPGFQLRAVRSQHAEGAATPMEHLVYSDGVASVSVFIEADVDKAEQGEGVLRLGAANTYTTMVNGHLVTAVGEVPVRTVEMIAKSVRLIGSTPAGGPSARN